MASITLLLLYSNWQLESSQRAQLLDVLLARPSNPSRSLQASAMTSFSIPSYLGILVKDLGGFIQNIRCPLKTMAEAPHAV